MENSNYELENIKINQTNLKINPIINEKNKIGKKGNVNIQKKNNLIKFKEIENMKIESENKKKVDN